VEKSGVPAYDRNGNPVTKSTGIKMFRHAFAVGWLAAGADKETVARMLGHISTEMLDVITDHGSRGSMMPTSAGCGISWDE
jgi:integrase